MLTIESRDRRYRATVEETEEGIRCQLLRHAGGVIQRGGEGEISPGMAVLWRIMETGVITDRPFHVVLDEVERYVWPLQDDRPIAWPVPPSRRR